MHFLIQGYFWMLIREIYNRWSEKVKKMENKILVATLTFVMRQRGNIREKLYGKFEVTAA